MTYPLPTWPDIRQAIPELHGLPASEPQRIDTGQNAIVWNAPPYIIRVPRHPESNTATGSSYREAAILQAIGPILPIPTPVMTVHDLPDGTTVTIHRALPGEPLMTIPDDDADRIATTLGTFLITLHSLPHAVLDGIAMPVTNRGHWRSWLNQAIRRLAPHLEPATLQRIADSGEQFLDAVATVSPALIHGDFGSGNILASDGEITGIIDFGSVGLGDPASDLAGLVASYGDGFLDRLEASYPGATSTQGRITFYRLAFAAMDALYGLDHADETAFRAGVASLQHDDHVT